MKPNNESDSLELFLSVYVFFKKYIIIFLIFLLLGAAYGVYKQKTQQPPYSKEILVYSEDISYILLKQFTIAMKKDLASGNYGLVAKQLGVDEKIARNISDCKTDSVALKGKVYTLTLFTFSDTAGTSGFSKHYIAYLSSVEYIHNLMENNREKYVKTLEKIDQKLAELDAVSLAAGKNGGSPDYLSNGYSEYIDLYSKKLDYEDRIKNYSEIKLIRESTSALGPNFGMTMSCVIYGMIFLVASLVVAFLIELFGKVRKLEKSRK